MKECGSSEILCFLPSVADCVQGTKYERFLEWNNKKFSDALLLLPSYPSRMGGHETEIMCSVLCK